MPALLGGLTQGERFVEAPAMAEEAILLYLEAFADEGKPIPVEAGDLCVHLGDAREAILRKLVVTLS